VLASALGCVTLIILGLEGQVTQAVGESDARIQEVAACSANFGLLLSHQPLLVLYGASAESSIFTDPSLSLFMSRHFGETLATELLRRAGIISRNDNQSARLQALTKAGLLDQNIRDTFENLNRSTNDSGPIGFVPELQALRAVRHCFKLGVWFHRLLSGDRELIPYIPPQLLTR